MRRKRIAALLLSLALALSGCVNRPDACRHSRTHSGRRAYSAPARGGLRASAVDQRHLRGLRRRVRAPLVGEREMYGLRNEVPPPLPRRENADLFRVRKNRTAQLPQQSV